MQLTTLSDTSWRLGAYFEQIVLYKNMVTLQNLILIGWLYCI